MTRKGAQARASAEAGEAHEVWLAYPEPGVAPANRRRVEEWVSAAVCHGVQAC